MKGEEARNTLKTMALDIEFLIISVIQGMALQMLAGAAAPVIGDFKLEYWPYIISGFILILVFWSQSVLHAWSFIDWPIDLIHSFLYFLACFVEVIAFYYITNPQKWYLFCLIFLLVMIVLYLYDLSIIKRKKDKLSNNTVQKKIYEHTYRSQLKEIKLVLPAAVLFQAYALWEVNTQINFYINRHYHLIFGILQACSSIILLIFSTKTFKSRLRLIEEKYINI